MSQPKGSYCLRAEWSKHSLFSHPASPHRTFCQATNGEPVVMTIPKELSPKLNRKISLQRWKGISCLITGAFSCHLIGKCSVSMQKFTRVPPTHSPPQHCVPKKKFFQRPYHMEITTHSINYSLWGRDMWHVLQNQLKRQKIQSTHYVFSPDTAH